MNRLLIAAGVNFALILPAISVFAQEVPDAAPAPRSDTVGAAAGDEANPPRTDLNEVRPGPTAPPCTLSPHPCVYPHLVLAIDGGVSHFSEGGPTGFNTGVGTITSTGPVWGARVGVELLPWFAIDGHYIGTSNRADASQSVGGRRSLLTNAAVAELRFTIPTHYVEPYLFLGAGVYSTKITGSSTATPLYGSTEFGMPVGLGFGVPLRPGLSLGAEVVYHRLFGEAFEDDDEIGGGDPTSASVVLRARL